MKLSIPRLVKYAAPALLIALFAIVGLTSPVFAFDAPTQDNTANATDVILWGDNVTLDLEVSGNCTIDGDITITGAADFLENLFAFIIVAAVTAFVVLTKSIFGKCVTSILLLVYGLRMAIPEDIWSVLWMSGVVIALVGTSLIFKVIWDAVSPSVKKMMNRNKGDE